MPSEVPNLSDRTRTLGAVQHLPGMFNPYTPRSFYLPIKSQLLGTKCVFKNQDLQMFGLKLNKYEQFLPT